MIIGLKIVFLLGFLILIHEGGHFIVAKICKIDVKEFAIGFGPKLVSKKVGKTLYVIRLIPLGGYVNLEGEQEHSDKEGSFNKASIPKRLAVLFAGPVVNIVFGIVMYIALISIRYNIVVPDSSYFESIKFGFASGGNMIVDMIKGIVMLFTGGVTLDDMTGPVGISAMVSKTNGVTEFLYLLSIISISLGVTNLLPIIPLDGGKIALIFLEAIRRKPLNEETELKIQSAGFLLLIVFSIFVTIHDIGRL